MVAKQKAICHQAGFDTSAKELVNGAPGADWVSDFVGAIIQTAPHSPPGIAFVNSVFYCLLKSTCSPCLPTSLPTRMLTGKHKLNVA